MQARNAMRKVLIGSAVLLIVATAAYLRYHHTSAPIEVGYAGNREVTLWSTSAQVREPVAIVTYGEKLDVLQRFQDQVQVRTTNGTTGWIPDRDLLSVDLWQTSKDLEKKGASMPVEAVGHTKVLSNLHITPGRESLRIRQLNKDVALEVLERQPVSVASVQATGAAEDSSAAPGKKRIGGSFAPTLPIKPRLQVGSWAVSSTLTYQRRFRTMPARPVCASSHGSN